MNSLTIVSKKFTVIIIILYALRGVTHFIKCPNLAIISKINEHEFVQLHPHLTFDFFVYISSYTTLHIYGHSHFLFLLLKLMYNEYKIQSYISVLFPGFFNHISS